MAAGVRARKAESDELALVRDDRVGEGCRHEEAESDTSKRIGMTPGLRASLRVGVIALLLIAVSGASREWLLTAWNDAPRDVAWAIARATLPPWPEGPPIAGEDSLRADEFDVRYERSGVRGTSLLIDTRRGAVWSPLLSDTAYIEWSPAERESLLRAARKSGVLRSPARIARRVPRLAMGTVSHHAVWETWKLTIAVRGTTREAGGADSTLVRCGDPEFERNREFIDVLRLLANDHEGVRRLARLDAGIGFCGNTGPSRLP